MQSLLLATHTPKSKRLGSREKARLSRWLCPYCKTPVYFKHYAAPFLPKPHSAIDDSLHVRCIESRVWAQNHGDSAPEDGDVLPHENEDLSTGRGVGRSAAMQEQDCEGSLEGDGDQGG